MDMQKFVDTLNEAGRLERAHYHITLGKLIKILENTPPEFTVEYHDGEAPDDPDSYRGYYSDLAFWKTTERVTVEGFLSIARECVGKTFQGYKGGDFTMSEDTPLWCACYGACGEAIMGARVIGDRLILTTVDLDA